MIIVITSINTRMKEIYPDEKRRKAFRALLADYLETHITDSVGVPAADIDQSDEAAIRARQRAETDAALAGLFAAIGRQFPKAAKAGVTKLLSDIVFTQVVEFHNFEKERLTADAKWGTQSLLAQTTHDPSWGTSRRRSELIAATNW